MNEFWSIVFLRMGCHSSRPAQTEKELVHHLRKRNCKISKQIYKIIEKAYQAGYLQEFEFHATIGWYLGLKFRHFKEKDDIFIAGIDRLNDFVCGLIQERHEALLHKVTEPPAEGSTATAAKKVTARATEVGRELDEMATYFKMLEASPYLQVSK